MHSPKLPLFRCGWQACVIALLGAVLAPQAAAAQSQPTWELGAGVGALAFPAYRGSSRYDGYLLPTPYVVYRGDHLRVDREGVRGMLVDEGRLEIDISGAGALPARRGKIPEREGMPSLDPVFELGPSLDIRLSEPAAALRWELKLPLRAVFAIGDGLEHVGWVAHPMLTMTWSNALENGDLIFSAGPLFADHDYHAYYYDVGARHALTERQRFRAGSGYSGSSAQLGFSQRRGRLWVGGFIRYDNLTGAVFEDSPLVNSNHSVIGGVAIAWVFWQSPRAGSP